MFQMLHEIMDHRPWHRWSSPSHLQDTGQRKVMLSTQGTKYSSDAQNDINVEDVDPVTHCLRPHTFFYYYYFPFSYISITSVQKIIDTKYFFSGTNCHPVESNKTISRFLEQTEPDLQIFKNRILNKKKKRPIFKCLLQYFKCIQCYLLSITV